MAIDVWKLLDQCRVESENKGGTAVMFAYEALSDAVREAIEASESKLAELHAIAEAHNPRPPSPETRARFEAKQRELDADPVKAKQAWENVQRALEAREPMDADERAKNEALWDAWDAEREPHEKAKLQMRLGESVASWMHHTEAVERERDSLYDAMELSVRENDQQLRELADAIGLQWEGRSHEENVAAATAMRARLSELGAGS